MQSSVDDAAYSRPAPALDAALDVPLPSEIVTGAGTALFVCGWCHAPRSRVRKLAIEVGGISRDLIAHGMPRVDVMHELGEPSAYRSGFWGIARVAPVDAEQELPVKLHAELEDRSQTVATLASIRVRPALEVPEVADQGGDQSGSPRVAICLATCDPSPALLEAQLQSIRAQTHENWICVISDDCSSSGSSRTLQEAIGEDGRFVVSRSSQRLGVYHNTERALSMAPAGVDHVALLGERDRWHPDKLETLLRALGDASLVYSDARLLTPDGIVCSDTRWNPQRNNHTDLHSVLVGRSVIAGASLMPRSLLDDALPFPSGRFTRPHDHWLTLVALALGVIHYVDRPLYDSVETDHRAAFGSAGSDPDQALSWRPRDRRTRTLREQIRASRAYYFADAAALLQSATVLESRCGARLGLDKRQRLEDFLAGERSPRELATLLAGGIRELSGGIRELTGRPEALGPDWALLGAFVWRLALSASARERPHGSLGLDAAPPVDLAPGSGRARDAVGAVAPAGDVSPVGEVPPVATEPPATSAAITGASVRAIADKIAPLEFGLRSEAPVRVNLLIGTIEEENFSGGQIATFNLALALTRGGRHVRIVTTDPTEALPGDWIARVRSQSGLESFGDQVEILFGRELPGAIEVSDSDTFVATTWPTAHIARQALQDIGGEHFLYLVQDYEPLDSPHGTDAALATQSYTFPHMALFSTELLRDYFRGRRIGVYVDGPRSGDEHSVAFNDAITSASRPAVEYLRARSSRRLLFDARPDRYAARGLFELGVLAIQAAAGRGCFDDGWELHGIGAGRDGSLLELGDGLAIELRESSGPDQYGRLLGEYDVGLALMYTPHPGLATLEMAAAGMLTVTNTFANKTPDVMARISSNLIVAEPTVESIAEALVEATARAGDIEARVAGSGFDWPRTWSGSFDERVLTFVDTALRRLAWR